MSEDRFRVPMYWIAFIEGRKCVPAVQLQHMPRALKLGINYRYELDLDHMVYWID